MKLPSLRRPAFTLIELLVVIAIIAILATLAVPQIQLALNQARMGQTAHNANQVAKLWGTMVVNNVATQVPRIAWPGDLYENTAEGKISNVKDFYQRLVDLGGIRAGELSRLLVAPGKTQWTPTDNSLQQLNADGMNPFKVYLVRDADPTNTAFIATKNFTYNHDLGGSTIEPYRDQGFVLIRKLGDGTVYRMNQSKSLSTLGLLPGRKSIQDNPNETASDYLSDN